MKKLLIGLTLLASASSFAAGTDYTLKVRIDGAGNSPRELAKICSVGYERAYAMASAACEELGQIQDEETSYVGTCKDHSFGPFNTYFTVEYNYNCD